MILISIMLIYNIYKKKFNNFKLDRLSLILYLIVLLTLISILYIFYIKYKMYKKTTKKSILKKNSSYKKPKKKISWKLDDNIYNNIVYKSTKKKIGTSTKEMQEIIKNNRHLIELNNNIAYYKGLQNALSI